METPFYGRTGLLASNRDGLPVEKLRLLSSGTTAALKWSPTLLTVPQLLLHHLVGTGETLDDASFSTFLRVAAVAEAVCAAWPGGAAPTPAAQRRRRALTQSVLAWAAARRAVGPGLEAPHRTDWYLPSLKLLTTKDGAVLAQLPAVSARAVTLLGKDHAVNDVALDHLSCSAQHAALQVQFTYAEMPPLMEKVAAEVPAGTHGATLAALWAAAAAEGTPMASSAATGPIDESSYGLYDALWTELRATEAEVGDFAALWTLELQLVDLMSTNGSFVNGQRLEPFVPTNLIDGDVLTFGASTRQYVLLRAS